MNKTSCVLGIAIFLSVGEIFPEHYKDDSYIIRRAYLDVLGIVPTIDEIEWYCVYNTSGYFMAVDWLLKQPGYTSQPYSNASDLEQLLKSPGYKDIHRVRLSDKKREEIIFYVAGKNTHQTNSS